ncbi:MAG TPA: uroporphyrinogen decarboxylase [Actinomycetota bacterium]
MTPEIRDRFLRACHRQVTDATPVWFMRQAGRYLPEYAKAKGGRDVLELSRDPAAAVELTLQPLGRFDADAAILFSDIMVPLEAIGVGVRIEPGVGPVLDEPFRDEADLGRLRVLEPEADVPHVLEAIRLLREELEVPLIGFAGAPFTLASYLVEGGPSRDQRRTKALMRSEPAVWNRLMNALADIVLAHLRAQVEAGAQAVQLFDSWAGSLDPDDYERLVLPASERVLGGLADLRVPRIHFGVGTGELLGLMRRAGAEVVGVDWRVPLDVAWNRIGGKAGVQGNLDPTALLGPWEDVERKARDILRRADGRPGHIFNLGHGVLPETDPGMLTRLVDLVHEVTRRG